MNKFNDQSPKTRLLKVLLLLLERPNGYTKKQLAEKYNVHEDTIKKDFDEIRNAGFTLDFDTNYRYAIRNDHAYEYLKELLYFSDREQLLLDKVITQIDPTDQRLHQKIKSIHDISRLGSNLLNKAFLTKINLLEKAKQHRKQVILVDYRSTNSSKLASRTVEAFHISPADDMIQSFDVQVNALRHYRISRISRIEITKANWSNAGKHYIEATDPFRIATNQLIPVHIRLGVGGYNELIERFPLTLTYLHPSPEKADEYDLQCKVNPHFYGLTNFLLGYHDHVIEIVEPESLRDHIKNQLNKISNTLIK